MPGDERLRFTLSLGLQKLVMHQLTVSTPEGEALGRFEQRFTFHTGKND